MFHSKKDTIFFGQFSKTFYGAYFQYFLDNIGVRSLLTGNNDVMLTLLKSQRLKILRFFENIFRKIQNFRSVVTFGPRSSSYSERRTSKSPNFMPNTVQRLLVYMTHVTWCYFDEAPRDANAHVWHMLWVIPYDIYSFSIFRSGGWTLGP